MKEFLSVLTKALILTAVIMLPAVHCININAWLTVPIFLFNVFLVYVLKALWELEKDL